MCAQTQAQAQYQRRQPEKTALYEAMQRELASFIAEHEEAGRGLPEFVTNQFQAFMRCGVLVHGFVLKECQGCGAKRAVALSCKRRGLCPSCAGRRMGTIAAHLVDRVFPMVPVRSWTVSLPIKLRYKVAYDADLCREVHGIAVAAIHRWMRQQAKGYLGLNSACDAACGSVGFIHRARGDLALFVHYHILVVDGVYETQRDGAGLIFRALPSPTHEDIEKITERIFRRTKKLLDRLGLVEESFDSFADEQPLLAGCSSASIRGVAASGERAGKNVRRIRGAEPSFDEGAARRKLSAQFEGFNVHAGQRVPAHERSRLERLCRYAARGPISNDRMEIRDDDTVVYKLHRPWSDGTTAVVLSYHELLERLVAIVPRPHKNMAVYFGFFAPRHNLRRAVVPASIPGVGDAKNDDNEETPAQGRWVPWAELLRRVFLIDVLTCVRCGRAYQDLTLVSRHDDIVEILTSMGLSTAPPTMAPSRVAQAPELFDAVDDAGWDAV